jgi:predicted amidohydrolase YtcJ
VADEDVASAGQVLGMATTGRAATTPYGSRIGILAPGKAADLVLIERDKRTNSPTPISTSKPRFSRP